MLPFVSLDAVDVDQNGDTLDLEGSYGDISMIVVTTGSPSSGSVFLQGSHDGQNWVQLASVTGISTTPKAGSPPSSTRHVVRYLRAALGGLSGGSSPTVTATIAVAM